MALSPWQLAHKPLNMVRPICRRLPSAVTGSWAGNLAAANLGSGRCPWAPILNVTTRDFVRRLRIVGTYMTLVHPVVGDPINLSRAMARVALKYGASAGALAGQKIAGRPVYDTTSTGVPVLTGYTTEPPARSGEQNVVIINNTVNATPSAAPPAATTQAPPASEPAPANRAGKIFGLNPGTAVAKRADDTPTRTSTVIIPNPAENSLFRPLTPPTPVTSTPQKLTPPTPVGTSQPGAHLEVTRPQTNPTTNPGKVAAPTSSAPPAPSYQPAAPRPTVTLPATAVPVAPPPPTVARPTVIVSPPPQPSTVPLGSGTSGANSPAKNDPEKRADARR